MKKIALILLLGFGFTLSQAVAQDEDIIEYVEEVEYDEADEAEGGDKTSQSAEVAVTNESSGDEAEMADSTESAESSDESSAEVATESTSESSDKVASEQSDEAPAEVADSSESTDESTNNKVAEATEATEATETESTEEAQLEALDEAEFANSENSEYEDVEVAVETPSEVDEEMASSDEGDYTYSTSDDKSDITRWNYTEKEIVKKEKIRQRQAEREAEYEKSISRRRSGLFIGGGMGFSDTTLKGLAGAFASSFMGNEMSLMGIGVGAFAGWQIGFNEYAGVRMYGEFDYNLGKSIIVAKAGNNTVKADSNLWKALGNVDFYLEGNMGRNQTETLGVFLGIGAGYIYYNGGKATNNGTDVTWESLHMIGFVVNYGIHTILGTNHRLELFLRNYPFIKVNQGATYKSSDFTTNMDAWLRYSYMF